MTSTERNEGVSLREMVPDSFAWAKFPREQTWSLFDKVEAFLKEGQVPKATAALQKLMKRSEQIDSKFEHTRFAILPRRMICSASEQPKYVLHRFQELPLNEEDHNTPNNAPACSCYACAYASKKDMDSLAAIGVLHSMEFGMRDVVDASHGRDLLLKASHSSCAALCDLALLTDDRKKAKELLMQAITRSKYPRALFQMGKLEEQEGDAEMAERYYREAADQGHALAMLKLYRHYETKGDEEKARAWLQRAADSTEWKSGVTMTSLVGQMEQATEYHDKKEYKEALSLLVSVTRRGLLDAYPLLFDVLSQVGQTEALSNSRILAALEGHPESQYNLGQLQWNKLQCPEVALQWFQRAAEQGHVPSMHRLGLSYYVMKKHDVALLWSVEAAKHGSADAMVLTAQMLFSGVGAEGEVPESPVRRQKQLEAVQWIQKAADLKNPNALLTLSRLVSATDAAAYGLVHDPEHGKALLRKAAKKGSSEAEYSIALEHLVAKDQQSIRDPETARVWALKAATKGNADAMYLLGTIYSEVLVDAEQSLLWLFHAAKQGHPSAREALVKALESKENQQILMHVKQKLDLMQLETLWNFSNRSISLRSWEP